MAPIIETLHENPACLLDGSVDSSQMLQLVKALFDPITKGNSVLDEIYVEGLDASQVWPQAKIILDSVTENLLFEQIPALKETGVASRAEETSDAEASVSESDENDEDENDNSAFPQSDNESEDFDNMDLNGELQDDFVDEDEEQLEDDDEEEDEEEEEEQAPELTKPHIKKDKFGLNDEFFSIDDFNKQILAQEEGNQNDDDDDDGIDYFGELEDSEGEEDATYADFFAAPNAKKDTKKSNQKPQKNTKKEKKPLTEEDEYDEGIKSAMMDLFADEDEPEQKQTQEKNLSSYERQQMDIQKEIAKLEKEAVAEKKWAMKGEAKAKDRPQDALLEEELEFERTAKPVPVITREVTESLEEMIRRRIKEGNFDDLPRRVITDVTNFRSSSSFELSEQKSSKSLAEMYEEEYKGENSAETAISEELQKSHDEVKEMFKALSYKLDALSSAHFIPKPAQKAIDIKVNTASITMEDAQPLTHSSSSTLAPQEIYKANNTSNANEIELKSGTVFARDELSREDKQRMRRANKRKRARDAYERDASKQKKSKKQDVIDTLSKAKNVTVIDNKGQRRDVAGNVKKDKVQQGTSALKL